MLKGGDHVLVAVSGGADSVCLLFALHTLAPQIGVSLHVAHLDHMFRGKESADEAVFVQNLAIELSIPATIEHIDVPAYCRERGLSAQAGAREVRYGFLNRIARDVGASRIATGHTATDQAETFLLRLLRGAGVSGLAAIPPQRSNIIRPLIEVTREEILDYLQSQDIPFVFDSSNDKPVYTRNRIRLEALPVLRQFNPRIVETLASEAALLRIEDEAMQEYLDAVASSVIMQNDEAVVVKRTGFDALPPAMRRRLVKKAADLAGMKSSELSTIQVEEALSFMADAQTGRTLHLPGGFTIGREYDQYRITRTAETAKAVCRELTVPGLTTVPELDVTIEAVLSDLGTPSCTDKNYRWQAVFDYDKIMPPLTVRNRRPGDWFCPSGMGGKRKKLQDYLVDEKIPRRQRDRIPLLCSGDAILWVLGLRTDERFLVRSDTVRTLHTAVQDMVMRTASDA